VAEKIAHQAAITYARLEVHVQEHVRRGWLRALTDQRFQQFFRRRPINTRTMAAYVFEREAQGTSNEDIHSELWQLRNLLVAAARTGSVAEVPRIPLPALPPPPPVPPRPVIVQGLSTKPTAMKNGAAQRTASAKLTDAEWQKHLSLHPLDRTGGNGSPLGAPVRVRLLLKDQGIGVDRSTVTRRLKASRLQASRA
jgi:hypothetical protein